MNRRELLKSFGAAGIAISLPAGMLKAGSAEVEQMTAEIVKASDGIVLDLNKLPCISIETSTENNVTLLHTIDRLETYPQIGMCDRTVQVQLYVEENVRRLFNELDQHHVHVIYRQPRFPNAELLPTDPILINSKAILDSMEMSVSAADFDVEATLNLRLVA